MPTFPLGHQEDLLQEANDLAHQIPPQAHFPILVGSSDAGGRAKWRRPRRGRQAPGLTTMPKHSLKGSPAPAQRECPLFEYRRRTRRWSARHISHELGGRGTASVNAYRNPVSEQHRFEPARRPHPA